MFMSMLIIIGAVIGSAVAALGHPMIWRGVFGGRRRSDDHKPECF